MLAYDVYATCEEVVGRRGGPKGFICTSTSWPRTGTHANHSTSVSGAESTRWLMLTEFGYLQFVLWGALQRGRALLAICKCHNIDGCVWIVALIYSPLRAPPFLVVCMARNRC